MRKKNRKKDTDFSPPQHINYGMLMRHEALESAREPPERLICRERPECEDCPYPSHGFVCWVGNCMGEQMKRIQRGGNNNESQDLSGQPGQG